YNKYKQHFIETKVPDGTTSTVYRCGPMIDLCIGPHVPHTGRIKSFMVTKHSASYWLGDAANDSLQRVYGISFPDNKQMEEYKEFLKEASRRDHRKIGKDQELWFFDEISPGSCFFLPNGVRIYNALIDLMRGEYRKRGYQEVISPNVFSSKLWETSGHWDHYRENMFVWEIDNRMSALKAMNCPGHCVMFDSRDRSYRELPLRLAEFGVIHRNEASGALSGLTRVRRFVQDDSHICMPEQIKGEMDDLFRLLDKVYSLFGFEYKLELSTRPESFLGDIETWNSAEKGLEDVLNEHYPGKWNLNPGDGAFYGPKIDIRIQDALKRWHQCATIQLDFQLPQRFNLKYRGEKVGEEGAEPLRPVIIHRAVLGSLERFIAVITEHFGGKWPFWLSPRQVLVIPVSKPYYDYANEVRDKLWDAGVYADVDNGPETMKKKILLGETSQYNFIFVVGQDEMDNRAVNVRNRDADKKARAEIMPLDDVVAKLVSLKAERRLENNI
ncbi:threonyl-tRNA synthetase, partial [Serendipita sp. 398]